MSWLIKCEKDINLFVGLYIVSTLNDETGTRFFCSPRLLASNVLAYNKTKLNLVVQ